MPVVNIKLVEGRSPKQMESMIVGVSKAVSDALSVEVEKVTVIVEEISPTRWGKAGAPLEASS
jgi:4-oxalocrotonate tautomerase